MAADVNTSSRQGYACDHEGCDKRFKRRDRLIIHARTHTGERPFICKHEDCGKSYSRAAHLVRHQQNSHLMKKEEDKVFFPCSEKDCPKLFSSVQSLKKHCKTRHSNQAAHTYKCEWKGCGETFPKHHLLRSHSYSHTGLDPYTCSHPGCSQTFKWPSLLHRHRKIHQGYKCDAEGCEHVFDKWTLLHQHKSREHAQEYKCDVCSQCFSKRHWLSYHMQMHSEHRVTYPCPHEGCSRVYLDKRNLKTHQKRFHDKQRFPCVHQGCKRTFASKQKLKQHLLLHDPNRPPRPPKVKAPRQNGLRKPRKKKSVAAILTCLNEKDVVTHTLDPIELEEIYECHMKAAPEGDATEGQRFLETVLKPSKSDIEIPQAPESSEKESMLLKNVDLIRIAEECENDPGNINSEMNNLNEPTLYTQNSNDVQVSAFSSMEINNAAF